MEGPITGEGKIEGPKLAMYNDRMRCFAVGVLLYEELEELEMLE